MCGLTNSILDILDQTVHSQRVQSVSFLRLVDSADLELLDTCSHDDCHHDTEDVEKMEEENWRQEKERRTRGVCVGGGCGWRQGRAGEGGEVEEPRTGAEEKREGVDEKVEEKDDEQRGGGYGGGVGGKGG